MTKTKVLNINFHPDAGHGWFAIKRKWLALLGITDKISAYSYMKGNTIYLEEDSDMSIFVDAMTEKYPDVEFTIHTCKRYTHSPIRNYDRFVG